MTVKEPCWKCKGSGVVLKRKHALASNQEFQYTREQDRISNNKNALVQVTCQYCLGKGIKDHPLTHHDVVPQRRLKRGLVCPFKPPLDWIPRGPSACMSIQEAGTLLQPGEMVTALCGDWSIFQLVNGHRYTTDDLSTAAVALKHVHTSNISPRRHVDMGCGLGSVLFFTAYNLYSSLETSLGLEAQSIHVELARKTANVNLGTESTRLSIKQGDLRELAIDDSELTTSLQSVWNSFDLVTGTPPYFPSPNGVLPFVQGRGMCSFEIRGGIETYCKAAARLLAHQPTSRFVCCQTGLEIRRSEQALESVGMQILERWDFYGKLGKPSPLFVVFVSTWKQHSNSDNSIIPSHDYSIIPIHVRDTAGDYTQAYKDILVSVDKPPV